MKRILFLFFLSVTFLAQGQDETKAFGTNSFFGEEAPRVIIMPFEPRMFISDFHQELSQENNIGVNEVPEELHQALFSSFQRSGNGCDVIPLDNEMTEVSYQQLKSFFFTLKYDYEKANPLPNEEKRRKVFDLKTESSEYGSDVVQGEIRSYNDGTQRFMDPRVNEEKVKNLMKDFQGDYMIFLTELDYQVQRNPGSLYAKYEDRVLRLHFAIYDKEGEKRYSSVVAVPCDAQASEISRLMNNEFVQLSTTVIDCLNSIVTSNVSSKKQQSKRNNDDDY